MPNIKFGISGSDFEIKNNVLFKKTNNTERFKKQITKQINFKEIFDFKTPKVFSFIVKEELSIASMEYIDGLDCISFFSLCDKTSLENVSKNLINFLNFNLKNSKLEFINKEIFFNKLRNINIEKNLKKDVEKYLNSFEEEIILPVGNCHGDLTFTNMIFQNNKIFLIDFLDCFLESPLQDIVKLRQETDFYWSILQHKNKINEKINYNKICIYYSFIDELIDNEFKKFDWYKKYYNLIQIFNLIRILPYNKNKELEIKLNEKIKILLKENK